MKGRVKFYHSLKQFGFIEMTNEVGGTSDVFFHFMDNDDFEKVQPGDAVVFELGSGPHGDRAVNVKKDI